MKIILESDTTINNHLYKKGTTIKYYEKFEESNNPYEANFKAWIGNRTEQYGIDFKEMYNLIINTIGQNPSWFRIVDNEIEVLFKGIDYKLQYKKELQTFSTKIGVGEISFNGEITYLYVTIPIGI